MSNFVRYRGWWLVIAIASVLWAIGIQGGRPDAATCKVIHDTTGDVGTGCATPPQLGWAIAIAVVAGLMFIIATLARRHDKPEDRP